jgi:hypothetical protein
MSDKAGLGAAALSMLGFHPLDEEPSRGEAFRLVFRRLAELDRQQPELGIRARVQEALHDPNPLAGIRSLLKDHQQQLLALSAATARPSDASVAAPPRAGESESGDTTG